MFMKESVWTVIHWLENDVILKQSGNRIGDGVHLIYLRPAY